MDFREKMNSCSGMSFREYIEALEMERQKIQVFQRELPLCLDLVTQTIERCKQQLSSGAGVTTEYMHGHQSECTSEHVTSSGEEHVFEEFIPLKRTCSANSDDANNNNDDDDVDDEDELQSPADESTENHNSRDNRKKSEWLKSVQLWSDPNPDPPQKLQDLAKSCSEVKRNGGAFQPFQRESNEKSEKVSPASVEAAPAGSPAPAASSSGGGGGKREEQKEGQRKQRRNWSPELHKRFLNALQQLGGSHVATPKQIRELMKVDGLTNDEVKSHLQKYRLHTRRPAQAIQGANGNTQTPQVVFVGGIWVQPSDYVAAVAAATNDPSSVPSNGIYAPVAVPPPVIQRTGVQKSGANNKKGGRSQYSGERTSHVSECGVQHSNSPATSSSTHTTTTSPTY